MIGPYRLQRVLGEGLSAVVRQAVHVKTGQQVAVKILSRSGKRGRGGKNDEEAAKRVALKACREAAALRAVEHPNIVRMYGAYQTLTHLFLVLELVHGVPLFDYLQAQRGSLLSPREALYICAEVTKGLMACHRHGVAHRDIKAENVMIDRKGQVRIIDFDLANRVEGEMRTACGSSYYVPPEICRGETYDGRKADVWSLGVLLYTMLVGHYPFDDESEANLLKKILHQPVEVPPHLGPELKDLLQQLLAKDPTKRISSCHILNHRVFCDSKGRNAYSKASDRETKASSSANSHQHQKQTTVHPHSVPPSSATAATAATAAAALRVATLARASGTTGTSRPSQSPSQHRQQQEQPQRRHYGVDSAEGTSGCRSAPMRGRRLEATEAREAVPGLAAGGNQPTRSRSMERRDTHKEQWSRYKAT